MKKILFPLIILFSCFDLKAETISFETNCSDCVFNLYASRTSQVDITPRSYTINLGAVENGSVVEFHNFYGPLYFVLTATPPASSESLYSEELLYNVPIYFRGFTIEITPAP